MSARAVGNHVRVPTEITVALIALVGSAGAASIVTAASQLTRAARLRRRIERHIVLAQSFPPESVPARSLTMTARISAVELSARTCVVLAPVVIFISFSLGALMLGLGLVLSLLVIENVPPGTMTTGLIIALFLVSFATFYPLVPLSAQRAKLERKLLADPSFLRNAMTGDARVVIGLDRSLFEHK